MAEQEKAVIIIKGAESLNIEVRSASHIVEDEKGKVLYEKRKR